MGEYKLSSSAQSDLINIRRYTLDHWGETQWASYFNELKQSMSLLARNELIGVDIPNFGHNYRRFPLKNHVIYYIRKPDHIVVAAILGRNMSPAKHFKRLS
ncbi:type II toxin-antitoxin system RelE/ParE family toxin [Vibrio scophthalmi]|uniref:Toxin n=1 Tax=Vibrio scophthalmi LMG 19158 TaxID=870967 RepID=F9RN45_9VIBR|nr:type II toxin-antitoxin system RelE/ParE family toxin [Vibrio scophthalmi]EGU37585.1 plasmid stabilization protein ParE [Vibrio scophthalmi LMG 19158]